ncbi:MAG: YkgJ family cysteine cluster protein [Desulfobacterales bacterium]|nr:YkgJ family cysteine cluster protein [Desulfobacterales bacterium]
MEQFQNRPYFFDTGIRFECRQCGTCCTGEPGSVLVSAEEVSAISAFLKIEVWAFIERYLYPFRGSFSIREHPDGRCLFYENGCTIYPVRPTQCKTYPFWFNNMRSKDRWIKTTRECPGIGQGRLFIKEDLLDLLETELSETNE